MKSIVLREKGLPVEIALRLAISQKLLSDDRLDELHKELYGIVEEATVKFVGFFATKSVKTGLDVTLSIISLALEHQTRGAYEPDVWVHYIGSFGFKNLAGITIRLFKELSDLPPAFADRANADTTDPFSINSPKRLILDCFLNRNDRKRLSDYRWYRIELSLRRDSLIRVSLVEELCTKLTRTHWKDWSVAQGKAPPTAESVINTVFLRVCLGLSPGLEVSYDTFEDGRKHAKSMTSAEKKEAERRLESFVRDTVSKNLAESDFVCTWYSVYFVKMYCARSKKVFDDLNIISFFRVVLIPKKIERSIYRSTDKILRLGKIK